MQIGPNFRFTYINTDAISKGKIQNYREEEEMKKILRSHIENKSRKETPCDYPGMTKKCMASPFPQKDVNLGTDQSLKLEY